ncbi:MAG: hypothetical protein JSV82_00765 [Planctomycetota bacterium]|nr:MAG: hypothetical protein JSV82_00765 [Planctomycetota bacterium]
MLNIFEQPWSLLTLTIIASLILVVFRWISPEKQRWHHWLLPALLVFAAFGADVLVQTDKEKIKEVITTGVNAIEQEKPDLLDTIIAGNYSDSYHIKKSRLMGRCKAWLSEPLVEKNVKRILQIQITPPTATVTFTVRTIFDKQSIIYETYKREMYTKLKVDLQKQLDKSWLINQAEILEIDRIPANWKDIAKPP